jgi:hypothetical protein
MRSINILGGLANTGITSSVHLLVASLREVFPISCSRGHVLNRHNQSLESLQNKPPYSNVYLATYSYMRWKLLGSNACYVLQPISVKLQWYWQRLTCVANRMHRVNTIIATFTMCCNCMRRVTRILVTFTCVVNHICRLILVLNQFCNYGRPVIKFNSWVSPISGTW